MKNLFIAIVVFLSILIQIVCVGAFWGFVIFLIYKVFSLLTGFTIT